MAVWDDILGEISSQSRSLFKEGKKCLHVGTVLFVGSVFVGTEFLFDCRVGLLGTGVGEGVGGGIVCLSVVYYLFTLGWLVLVIWIGKCFLLLAFLLHERTLLIPDRYFFFFSIVRYQKSACGSSIAVRATWNLSPGSMGSMALLTGTFAFIFKIHFGGTLTQGV